MPLVAHTKLPTFDRLRARGQEILSLERALSQDIRELHIGLLNMMPDAALTVTEQQFMRLIGSSNKIAQFYVHPFSVPGLPRSAQAEEYIRHHYASFDELRAAGLDALIISGANVTNPAIELEPFWEPLKDVIAWASKEVTSSLCSCLSTHALVKHLHAIDRHRLPTKRWGVYSHQVLDRHHPLMQDINTRFDVPHSRWNEVRSNELEAAGLKTLVQSEVAGLHMAVSIDQFRLVYMQGHPEYGANSLLKEYKREVLRFLDDEIEDPPPYPENYFSAASAEIVEAYLRRALRAIRVGGVVPEFPEAEVEPHLHNTWTDTGKAIFNNWLGLVYQYTGHDRRQPFLPGIDPGEPLGLSSSSR